MTRDFRIFYPSNENLNNDNNESQVHQECDLMGSRLDIILSAVVFCWEAKMDDAIKACVIELRLYPATSGAAWVRLLASMRLRWSELIWNPVATMDQRLTIFTILELCWLSHLIYHILHIHVIWNKSQPEREGLKAEKSSLACDSGKCNTRTTEGANWKPSCYRTNTIDVCIWKS